MTRGGLILNSVIAGLGILAFTVMAGIFGYKWLGGDEVDRAHPCGSGSRSGTCLAGETANMVLTFVFGGLAIVGILLTVNALRRHNRREREYTVVTSVPGQQSAAALHLHQLDALRAAGVIPDADYRRQRQQAIADN